MGKNRKILEVNTNKIVNQDKNSNNFHLLFHNNFNNKMTTYFLYPLDSIPHERLYLHLLS